VATIGPRRAAVSERLRQRIGVLALVVVGLLFMWRSVADLPFGTIDNPGPGITPFMLAILLIVFALWSTADSAPSLVDRADDGNTDVSATDDGTHEPGAARHAVFVILGIVAAALGFGLLGYRLTVLALLLFYLGAVERKPILPTLLVSFGIAFGSHALFVHVLKVSLPTGPWGL
jgi:hypothetical protein